MRMKRIPLFHNEVEFLFKKGSSRDMLEIWETRPRDIYARSAPVKVAAHKVPGQSWLDMKHPQTMQHSPRQARNQEGATVQLFPRKFLKTCLVVWYNIKLQ